MPTISEQEIAREIKEHVDGLKGNYGQWKAGITENPEDILFVKNNIDRYNGKWIYRIADDFGVAKKVSDVLKSYGFEIIPTSIEKVEGQVYIYAFQK